jgi:Arb2 domain
MLFTALLSFYVIEVSHPESGRLLWLIKGSPVAESVHQRVLGVIVFIAENPVRPVHSNENPFLSKWYSQNSNVFVAHTHSLWTKTDRKMSRRYGRVERSPGTMLNEMLVMHRDQVFAWVAEKTGLDHTESEEGVHVTEDLVMSLEKPDIQNGTAYERE